MSQHSSGRGQGFMKCTEKVCGTRGPWTCCVRTGSRASSSEGLDTSAREVLWGREHTSIVLGTFDCTLWRWINREGIYCFSFLWQTMTFQIMIVEKYCFWNSWLLGNFCVICLHEHWIGYFPLIDSSKAAGSRVKFCQDIMWWFFHYLHEILFWRALP